MPDDNVTAFPKVPARTETRNYRRHTVKLRYMPGSRQWHWSFEHTPPSLVLSGDANSIDDAFSVAKERIDHLVDGVSHVTA